MNERINQLDKQAVAYALSVCDASGVYRGKEYLAVVKEKFAELIVLECADIGERYADGNYEVRNQILEHFGVAE